MPIGAPPAADAAPAAALPPPRTLFDDFAAWPPPGLFVTDTHILRAVLVGALPLSDHIVRQRERPLLVGPDSESAQWVAAAAARHGLDYVVCTKVRSGDRDVAVDLPATQVAGRATVILDDMASTGHTVAQATQGLRAAGALSVDVAVTLTG